MEGIDQPLAKGKNVHRKVESEGSWRQNSDLYSWGKTAGQVENRKQHEHEIINDTSTWKKSELEQLYIPPYVYDLLPNI